MRYIVWTEQDIEGLEADGLARLITEIDEAGQVTREVGLDAHDRVVYRSPSEGRDYGFFDSQVVTLGEPRSELSPQQFERLWRRPR